MAGMKPPFVVSYDSSIPDREDQDTSCPPSCPRHSSVFAERHNAFTPAECRALAERLLDSALTETNRLSSAFEGSAGFQAVFRRDGLDEFCASLPMLIPFFEVAATPAGDAFFINALIVRDGVEVKPHLDCSLDPFLPSHTAPEMVSVLYVQVPEDLRGGTLQLYGDGEVSEITPSVGLLVQFRGDTAHAISDVRTSSERISVILEEFQLGESLLGSVPKFSLYPDRSHSTSRRAYEKVCEFISSLTPEEQEQLRILAEEDQGLSAKLNSSE